MMEILRTLKKSRRKETKDGVLPVPPPPPAEKLHDHVRCQLVTGVTKSQGKKSKH